MRGSRLASASSPSAATRQVNSLATSATAKLLIANGSTFTIDNGTERGANTGTIAIGDDTKLVLGGIFKNIGKLTLNSTGNGAVLSSGTLTGGGKVLLSDDAGNLVSGVLANLDNTISGAGAIHAGLDNE